MAKLYFQSSVSRDFAEIILICWFGAFIINEKNVWLITSVMHIFSGFFDTNIVITLYTFTVIFDQCNASLLNKCIKISAAKRLIASKIQVFIDICVYCVYLLCLKTNIYNIYFENIYINDIKYI